MVTSVTNKGFFYIKKYGLGEGLWLPFKSTTFLNVWRHRVVKFYIALNYQFLRVSK